MPLKKSASAAAIGPNIKAEEKAGKPYDQALAIALSVQDQAKKHKHVIDLPVVAGRCGGTVANPAPYQHKRPLAREDSGWEPIGF